MWGKFFCQNIGHHLLFCRKFSNIACRFGDAILITIVFPVLGINVLDSKLRLSSWKRRFSSEVRSGTVGKGTSIAESPSIEMVLVVRTSIYPLKSCSINLSFGFIRKSLYASSVRSPLSVLILTHYSTTLPFNRNIQLQSFKTKMYLCSYW